MHTFWNSSYSIGSIINTIICVNIKNTNILDCRIGIIYFIKLLGVC
jgi:hypothetical protein